MRYTHNMSIFTQLVTEKFDTIMGKGNMTFIIKMLEC